ncbi:MAG: FtsX-like permease family protein [Clostridiales bacterium]|nr:FtsX-like permease family protein [Clostridiales bacterium]
MNLFKKAVRSIWRSKAAYISCVVLVAVAVYMYAAMGASSAVLEQGAEIYYREQRMADAFAEVVAIPKSASSSLTQIEGVYQVQMRLVRDARVIMPDRGASLDYEKTIWLRLISFDTDEESPLNAPVVDGGPLSAPLDIWLGQGFKNIHGLENGAAVTVALNGREVAFNIVGGAESPDFVYAVRDTADIYPDAEAFGIAYVEEESMGILLGAGDAFNQLSFALEAGYDFDSVKASLTDALTPYGLTSLVARENQFSYSMLDSEIVQTKAMSTVMPVVFAAMAALILLLMMKRVIEQERTQIGVLKAFGYTNTEILTHYIMYGVVTSAAGGLLGLLLGYFSVGPLVDMYMEFFTIPGLKKEIPAGLMVQSILLAIGTGIIGTYAGARPVLSLMPADAMRPPAAPPVKSDIMRSLPFLRVLLSSRGSMGMRNITRAKLRSLFIVVGIMFSFGMIAFITPMISMFTDMMTAKFTKIQTYDAKLVLALPMDAARAARDARGLPGVYVAETLRQIPAEVRYSHLKEGYMIIGVKRGSALYRIYDDYDKSLAPLPASGALVTNSLADKLMIKPGGTLMVTTPYNEDELPVRVSGIIHQNGVSAMYMDTDVLNAMLDLPDEAEAVMVRTTDSDGLKAAMEEARNIMGFEETKSAVVNFMQMMNSYQSIIYMMAVLAVVVAFAIIYNSSTISMSEKSREYATLRVLGMHIREVGEIHGFEYWVLFAAGALFGIPFTKLLMISINEMMKQMVDAFEFPTTLSFSGLAAGFVGCLAAVFLSNRSTRRKIKFLDMVEVLKERE